MTKQSGIILLIVFAVGILLSIGQSQQCQRIDDLQAENARNCKTIADLAMRVYSPEPINYNELERANYCMEMPLDEQRAIIWKTRQGLEGRKYILIENAPPDLDVKHWENGHIRTLPWQRHIGI